MNALIREKSAFAVAFLAVVTAIGGFKEEMRAIPVAIGLWEPTVFQIAVAFLLFLSVAGYLYGISMTLEGSRFTTEKWIRIRAAIANVANFIFGCSLLIPIFIFCAWLVTVGVLFLNPYVQLPAVTLGSNIIIVLYGLWKMISFGLKYAKVRSKTEVENIRRMAEREIDVDPTENIENAEGYMKEKDYANVIRECGTAAKNLMRVLLRTKGIEVDSLTFTGLIDIATETKLITQDDRRALKYVRIDGRIIVTDMHIAKMHKSSVAKKKATANLKIMKALIAKYAGK